MEQRLAIENASKASELRMQQAIEKKKQIEQQRKDREQEREQQKLERAKQHGNFFLNGDFFLIDSEEIINQQKERMLLAQKLKQEQEAQAERQKQVLFSFLAVPRV